MVIGLGALCAPDSSLLRFADIPCLCFVSGETMRWDSVSRRQWLDNLQRLPPTVISRVSSGRFRVDAHAFLSFAGR